MEIKETLISFMTEQAYKPMNIKELSKVFDIKKADMKEFTNLLAEMEKSGEIVKTRTEHYGIPEKMGLVIGKFQGHQRGFGFVIAEEERPDIFIPADNVNGAMNGDKVLAKVLKEENNGKKCEGEITRIIERSNKTIIGTYDDSKNFGFVVADDKRIAQDIFIPKAERNGAKTGQIVIAEITEWPEQRRNPEGRIIEILGNKGDQGIDILTIIKKHKLPEEFPPKVEAFADNIVEEIPKEEYAQKNRFKRLADGNYRWRRC